MAAHQVDNSLLVESMSVTEIDSHAAEAGQERPGWKAPTSSAQRVEVARCT
jgi:hypothetical protein